MKTLLTILLLTMSLFANTSYKETHENGYLRFKIPYENGSREGVGYWYYNDSSNHDVVFAKIYFKNDEIYRIKTYSSTLNPGVIKCELNFKKGEITSMSFYDLDFNGMYLHVDMDNVAAVPDDKKFLLQIQLESWVKPVAMMLSPNLKHKLR